MMNSDGKPLDATYQTHIDAQCALTLVQSGSSNPTQSTDKLTGKQQGVKQQT